MKLLVGFAERLYRCFCKGRAMVVLYQLGCRVC